MEVPSVSWITPTMFSAGCFVSEAGASDEGFVVVASGDEGMTATMNLALGFAIFLVI